MILSDVTAWMLGKIECDSCLYQDDVVDFLVKSDREEFLKENADGNLALGAPLLNAFKKATETTVVWVKPDRYWRFRVDQDEPGREARG